MTTVKEFIDNQKEYCEKRGVPFFMPNSDNCWSCDGRFISRSIKLGKTGKEGLITGCSICNRSYVD